MAVCREKNEKNRPENCVKNRAVNSGLVFSLYPCAVTERKQRKNGADHPASHQVPRAFTGKKITGKVRPPCWSRMSKFCPPRGKAVSTVRSVYSR